MDWINLAQDRDQWKALMNTVMKLRVPSNARKLFSGCTIGSFSGRVQLRKSASKEGDYREKSTRNHQSYGTAKIKLPQEFSYRSSVR
jgi:hypothetical protein